MKLLLALIFGFLTGFLVHAFVFPDLLANGIIVPSAEELLSNEVKPTTADAPESADMAITFDGTKFSRNNITMGVTRYISITNESESNLMLLTSNEKLLKTPRGYGYKERVFARMDTKGTFTVHEVGSGATMVITVK